MVFTFPHTVVHEHDRFRMQLDLGTGPSLTPKLCIDGLNCEWDYFVTHVRTTVCWGIYKSYASACGAAKNFHALVLKHVTN